MQQPARGIALLELVQQVQSALTLVRAAQCHTGDRLGIPLRAVAFIDRHEGRFATHGESHIRRHQVTIDLLTECLNVLPLRIAVGQGDAWRLPHPLDLHGMAELGLDDFSTATDRRGTARIGGTGQRDMSFTSQQARGRVQTNPACARQINLAPGMQIGEVLGRTHRTVERFDIRLELDQVAGHKARRQPEMAQQLHQQPGGVAT